MAEDLEKAWARAVARFIVNVAMEKIKAVGMAEFRRRVPPENLAGLIAMTAWWEQAARDG